MDWHNSAFSFLVTVLRCNTQEFRETKESILARFFHRTLCRFWNGAHSCLLATSEPLEEQQTSWAFYFFFQNAFEKTSVSLSLPPSLLTEPLVTGHCTQHMEQRWTPPQHLVLLSPSSTLWTEYLLGNSVSNTLGWDWFTQATVTEVYLEIWDYPRSAGTAEFVYQSWIWGKREIKILCCILTWIAGSKTILKLILKIISPPFIAIVRNSRKQLEGLVTIHKHILVKISPVLWKETLEYFNSVWSCILYFIFQIGSKYIAGNFLPGHGRELWGAKQLL